MAANVRRRELVAALASTAALGLPAFAQQSERIRRVGVLFSTSEGDQESRTRASRIRKGLADLGWADGRNLQLDLRWIGGDRRRASLYAAELVGLKPDVIVAISSVCLNAVRNETNTIPIVFVNVGDPVGQGFVSNLAHPGGNITGFSSFEFEIGSKWLEFAKLIAPNVKRVAYVYHPQAVLTADKFARPMADAAPAHGVELMMIPVHDPAELDRVIARIGTDANSALVVDPDPFTITNRGLIISLAAQYRIPAIYPFAFFAKEGGLISYGFDERDQFRHGAGYVDKILRGARPADLPVQFPTKFEIVINLKTARTLGLDVPLQLQELADEIIE